ncbi:protein NRT1/ PTR FAMILY 5.9 [Malania oleifera]|uniref:protein NRT1/ PTR FAMILY 5.9 n=1 Tax=Malania oleifera TaxID=397392 RepID=UPI0025ADDDD6|nr:protein NRT1/ PTR FAMILY 5.9 [Malania oleifera]XP_057983290.1 protein NRT1/ PTR FAMILY 5.9 [Malania oleifera]XP_057983291.1 protein NRT1/ PTR FAMILY 5.9 [Malania oleifera]
MPEEQRSRRLNKSCVLLIGIGGMERFAFKGVACNLVTYLTDVVKMSNSAAAKTVNSWIGITSLLPLLVAPLADSYWDQFSTILASSFLYLVGLVALTWTAISWAWTPATAAGSSSALFWSLSLISLGQGGYNPSLQAFGADQLENDDELPQTADRDRHANKKKSLFFQCWYFGVCTGSLLGVSVMSYIQDTFGWGLGFVIPAIAMLASIVFFTCGSRYYTYRQAKAADVNKPFRSMARTVAATVFKMTHSRITLQNNNDTVDELELEEKPICHPHLEGEDLECLPTGNIRQLENVNIILRLLPIWTTLLMFAVIFQLPTTFFTKQGITMKRNIGSNFKIPPATLQTAITVSIILLMPLYDTILVPIMRAITHNDRGISVMQRMGIGMFLSIIAMMIAAIVETKRRGICQTMGSNLESETVPLSIFWLLPQYILLGISDIFTVVGMQEFFYSEVPIRMRTMGIALYTSVFGVGSFLSAILISMIEFLTSSSRGKPSWFSDNMSEARLDKYYWLLALSSALSLLLFVSLCKCYQSRNDLGSGGNWK